LIRPVLWAAVLTTFIAVGCDSGGPQTDPTEPAPEPPSASVQLTAESDGEEVALTWTAQNLTAAGGYRIFRGGEADFDTTGAHYASVTDTTAYRDTDVQVDHLYHYRVAVLNDKGETAALSSSDYARPEDVTAPKAPSNAEGAGGFYKGTLTWKGVGADDLDGYRVYRSTQRFSDVSQADLLTSSPVDTTGYVDDGVLDGERYFYRVTAVDKSRNESEPSSAAALTPTFSGDAIRGEQVFTENCATCHVNSDAWDLQAFAMPDTMIHRRALAHVAEQEAFDIIEFVHSGDVQPLPGAEVGEKERPPFQPGGRILPSDRAFAMEVFGQDQWPADLTPQDLLGVDVTEIPVPFRLPDWNVEGAEDDWLPTNPLPVRVADRRVFRSALRQYRSDPTDENMLQVYKAVHDVDRGWRDRYPFTSEFSDEDMAEVYELNRWISALVGSHVLRKGGNDMEHFRALMNAPYPSNLMQGDRWAVQSEHRSLVSEIWAVGDIMRMHGPDSNQRMPEIYGTTGRDIKQSTVRWFYLAWLLRPEGESSFDILYFPRLIHTAGYPRVAAFFTAHMVVNGKLGFEKVYDLLVDFPAPVLEEWVPNFSQFIVDAYVDRIERGDYVDGDTHHQRNHLQRGITNIIERNPHLTEGEKTDLREKRDFIISWLKEQEDRSQ
jgi:mono/diheme cytochrome c family protein